MPDVKYIAFFDGSLRINIMYYGWIVYNQEGEILEKFGSAKQEHNNTTNMAEYYGLLSLLRWFNANQISDPITIYGDSQLIIRQVKENSKSKAAHLNEKSRECREILSSNIELVWLPRAYNEADQCTRAIVMNPPEIKFWRTTEFYGSFSNFSRHPITVDDVFYATTEHYYQAQKATNPIEREAIRMAPTPKECKDIAQKCTLRYDWDTVKYSVMKYALHQKIAQHPDVKDLLLSTGDALLVENSPYDYIWGCGKDGTGSNLLGRAWMEVRNEIKNGK